MAYPPTSMTLVTASRINSAPATVTSALSTGISAERQPRNTKNNASSRIGNAINSPLTRSLWVAAIWSRDTASSPPTFTVAPGTASCSTDRTFSTWLCPVIGSSVLRTVTTIRLALPSVARSCESGVLYAVATLTTPGSADTFWLAASTAERVAGSSTGLPDTTATMLGPVPLALSRILKPCTDSEEPAPFESLRLLNTPLPTTIPTTNSTSQPTSTRRRCR